MTGKCVRVVIGGRVQGVGYRAWMAHQARNLGLRGWARNRANGNVEAVLCGPEQAVDTMTDLCRKGPRLSLVTNIDTSPVADENWPDFSVRPTA